MVMQPFYSEATLDSPQIIFDANKGFFSIIGRSLPEDAIKFYSPIFDWLNSYIDNPQQKSIFTFKFEHISSSSAKQVTKILSLLEKLSDYSEVNVKWYYLKDDRDILNFGEKISKIIKIQFEFIELENY